MIWKRIELHNHSIESDGCLTVPELVTYLFQRGIRQFSLTDHNTISGWRFLPAACAEQPEPMEYLQGLELTTYYGHLLCQNIDSYIRWDDIDETNADKLLRRIHEVGGLCGPAHPFAIPVPFSNGMRWSMQIHDHRLLDFIEIINRAHPFSPDNAAAIDWWRSLVLAGYPIAPVSGLDLHGPFEGRIAYTTYLGLQAEEELLPLSAQFDRAIRACRSCVTAGPIFDWAETASGLEVSMQVAPDTGLENNFADIETDERYNCLFFAGEKRLSKPLENGKTFFSFAELPADAHSAVFLCYQRTNVDSANFGQTKNAQRFIAAARPWFDRPLS